MIAALLPGCSFPLHPLASRGAVKDLSRHRGKRFERSNAERARIIGSGRAAGREAFRAAGTAVVLPFLQACLRSAAVSTTAPAGTRSSSPASLAHRASCACDCRVNPTRERRSRVQRFFASSPPHARAQARVMQVPNERATPSPTHDAQARDKQAHLCLFVWTHPYPRAGARGYMGRIPVGRPAYRADPANADRDLRFAAPDVYASRHLPTSSASVVAGGGKERGSVHRNSA